MIEKVIAGSFISKFFSYIRMCGALTPHHKMYLYTPYAEKGIIE
jgi:hypothetical protein